MAIGVVPAVAQCVLLLVLTVLVTVIYERADQPMLVSFHTYSTTTFPCAAGEKSCANASAPSPNNSATRRCAEVLLDPAQTYYLYRGLCRLVGESQEFHRWDTDRLFAWVGMPFLLLCSQVVSASFSLAYVREEHSHLQKNIKRISLLLQFAFAGSFLFLQNAWRIPGSNLLLGELLLLVSLFYISFHPSSHYAEHARQEYIPTRFVQFSLAFPLLSVAAAGSSGCQDVDALSWIFFTSLLMNLGVLGVELHHHRRIILHEEQQPSDAPATLIMIVNAWLCLVAFLVPASLSVQHSTQQAASSILMLLFHIIYLVGVTVFQVGGRQHHALFVWFLDAVSILSQSSVSLSVLLLVTSQNSGKAHR